LVSGAEPGNAGEDDRKPSLPAVREQLERILASAEFVATDRLRSFSIRRRWPKSALSKGAGSVSAAEPGQTPDGSSYHTDGLRTVLVFGGNAVSLAEVDFFDWERLVDHYRRHVATSERR
jgi:hypothetical protein